MEDTIRRLALINARKFNGKANPKAIIGGLVQEHPEAKEDMKSTMGLIQRVVGEVNAFSLEEQEEQLRSLDPEHERKQAELKQQRKDRARELPPLQGAQRGEVVTRMPPEPSKYAHLGHAMSFLINYLYAKMYDGRVVLRLDDTNPEKASQEYVDAMHHDVIEYLGAEPDSVVFASDHMEKYYGYAMRLIDDGHAYVCSCTQEEMKAQRREMVDCPHRDQSLEETRELWERMKEGEFEEGSHVLRLRVDMRHKNAVMRDPVIYRLSYAPHYKEGTTYKVWPMYDFESTVEEELCGVTHVMRGNEFDSRIELQHHIASLLGFREVTFKHYGRFTVQDAVAQGRTIRELIASGKYIGWDDPRLITLRALERRGILRDSYYELARQVGMSKQLTTLDFSVIAAINRNLLDRQAKRFFAVRDPVTIEVLDLPASLTRFELSFNPNEEKGQRVLAATKEYYVEREDHEAVERGTMVRLMDAMNLEKVEGTTYRFLGLDYEEYRSKTGRKGPLIHFIPKDGEEVRAEVFMPDTTTLKIIAESNVAALKQGEVIQFERFAFCRLDREGEKPLFWYTHE